MDDYQLELIKQGGLLLRSLIWPAVVLLLAFRFRQSITNFLRRMSEFSVKTPAGEFSAKAAEASALLGAAESVKERDSNAEPGADTTDVQTLARGVETAVRTRNFAGRSILWVDDDHHGNRYEKKAFEALGIQVDAVTTTEEALVRLRLVSTLRGYDLAITDLKRGSDRSAGVEFIVAARGECPELPIIVYTGRTTTPEADEARHAGAVYVTNKPYELFTQVMTLL